MPSIYYVPAFHKVIPNLPHSEQYIIFVDLQNIAVGKYDTESDTVLVQDLDNIVRNEVKYILEYLHTVYEKVPNSKVYFFYDENRNLFNEQLIPTWKETRKKELSKLTYDRKTIRDLSSNVSRAISDVLHYLSKYSLFLNVIKLKYVDSDFIPGLTVVNTVTTNNSKTSILIVSSDFDFIHLTQYPNVFLFDTKNRSRFKALSENDSYLPDNLQILLKKISKRFELKNEEESLKVYNNYQLFHALVGDQSDSIPPLIKKVGVKTILKKTSDLLNGKIVDNVVLDKQFGLQFLSRLTNQDVEHLYYQLLERLLVTDFTILSSVILEYNGMIGKKYLSSYSFLKPEITRMFKSIISDISESLKKEYTTYSKVQQVKSYFGIERDVEKMFLIQ